MKNNPVKLRFEAYTHLSCVILNSFYTYIDFRLNRHSGFIKWKCYNICIVIMPQILLVDFQKLFIRAENEIKPGKLSTLQPEYFSNKFLEARPVVQACFKWKEEFNLVGGGHFSKFVSKCKSVGLALL